MQSSSWPHFQPTKTRLKIIELFCAPKMRLFSLTFRQYFSYIFLWKTIFIEKFSTMKVFLNNKMSSEVAANSAIIEGRKCALKNNVWTLTIWSANLCISVWVAWNPFGFFTDNFGESESLGPHTWNPTTFCSLAYVVWRFSFLFFCLLFCAWSLP